MDQRRLLQEGGDQLHITTETHGVSHSDTTEAYHRLAEMTGAHSVSLPDGSTEAPQQPAVDICGLPDFGPQCTSYPVVLQSQMTIRRDQVEALLCSRFVKLSAEKRGGMAACPTLDDALVAGTPAHAILASIFVVQQEPFVTNLGAGHRRLQTAGDTLYVPVDVHAQTPAGASKGAHRIAEAVGGTVGK